MKNYIEMRVYLSDDADMAEVQIDAEDLKDTIIDTIESYGQNFTQDVTYTFHLDEK